MPSFGPQWLGDRLPGLLPQEATGLLVAVSGGADSTALLVALATLRNAGRLKLPLRALHVDHGLQTASRDFVAQSRRLARDLKVPLGVRRVDVPLPTGASLEAAARDARLGAFAKALKPGECLLVAQHADDQLETFLLQALRGAGVAGLAAMPERQGFARGWLLRPVLPLPGEALRAWLRDQGLGWVEDPTNADLRFDRNYLRQAVVPRIAARWPAAARTVARSARHAAEADVALRGQGLRDVAAAAVGPDLDITVLRRLSPARQKRALRAWLLERGLALPDEDRLLEVLRLFEAREDAQPCIRWTGVEIRRHAGLLVADVPPPIADGGSAGDWRWARQRRLVLSGGGSLELRDDVHGDIDLSRLPAVLRWGSRKDLGRRTATCDLKSLLRESGVPAWRRDAVPLLFDHDRLIAVADLWSDLSVKPTSRTRSTGRFVWRRR